VKFVPYHLLDGRPNLVGDGSPAPGTRVERHALAGVPAAAGIEDDLSARWRSAC
jgi:hypothetical protein